MATAKLTMISCYKWMLKNNDDLFANLSLPTGIDRDTVINNILLKGGEFEVLYSDPLFFKQMISIWSSKWNHTIERWIKALAIDYNPLENYDRMEDWTDDNNKNNVSNRKENAVGIDSSASLGTGNTENTRSAFDASDYQPHDKSESSSTGTNNSTSSTSASGVVIDNEKELNKRTGRAHGNIGVTTSQQMLLSEFDAARWNLYDEVADLFISEFCIYTY